MEIRQITRCELNAGVTSYLRLVEKWRYCKWGTGNFLYDLPSKWNLSFAVIKAEKLAGFCFASDKKGVYYIHLFYLDPDYQGQGYGTAMVRYAMDLARYHALKAIELRCPMSNNEALRFYQKNGFKTINLLRDCVSEDEADYYLRRPVSL